MRPPLAAEMQGAASETHHSLHQGPSEWLCTSLSRGCLGKHQLLLSRYEVHRSGKGFLLFASSSSDHLRKSKRQQRAITQIYLPPFAKYKVQLQHQGHLPQSVIFDSLFILYDISTYHTELFPSLPSEHPSNIGWGGILPATCLSPAADPRTESLDTNASS
ncbi:hypothetical protein MGYG_02880 [Nannizzia gypsea CBS 118893]|uniref:Uncharacterized protein n=1 Tax=Arthroderma gypseum (strain ATCC MYA-4604 / CBS 118893) TaxID=535722 RepID=E4UPJ3_ARTGP|nr:hypothetical protein MGYG_02880 [Nannizzia gypsea CBS 118893]EFQ99868.1 hypothetical protein MGYG_02880 [Nannizzia gypsea CBS 118893]